MDPEVRLSQGDQFDEAIMRPDMIDVLHISSSEKSGWTAGGSIFIESIGKRQIPLESQLPEATACMASGLGIDDLVGIDELAAESAIRNSIHTRSENLRQMGYAYIGANPRMEPPIYDGQASESNI